jgi:hypothetical protein
VDRAGFALVVVLQVNLNRVFAREGKRDPPIAAHYALSVTFGPMADEGACPEQSLPATAWSKAWWQHEHQRLDSNCA